MEIITDVYIWRHERIQGEKSSEKETSDEPKKEKMNWSLKRKRSLVPEAKLQNLLTLYIFRYCQK